MTKFQRGDKVYNKLHGKGTIQKYLGFGDYTVKWDSGKIGRTNQQFLKRGKEDGE